VRVLFGFSATRKLAQFHLAHDVGENVGKKLAREYEGDGQRLIVLRHSGDVELQRRFR